MMEGLGEGRRQPCWRGAGGCPGETVTTGEGIKGGGVRDPKEVTPEGCRGTLCGVAAAGRQEMLGGREGAAGGGGAVLQGGRSGGMQGMRRR